MYKTIFPILFLLAVTTASARADFFVSINGSDGNPGTREEPFATLERAREAVREMKQKAEADGAIHVWLREGNYVLREPLKFTPRDSGTQDSPVIYAAHGGEEVTLSGGTKIEGWKHIAGNLWKTQLPTVKAGEWYFRQLFADGRRLTRARIPNKGYLYTEGPLSQYAEPDKRRHGWNYSVIGGMRKNQPEVFCGFSFKPGDIHTWENYKDAEVITYHSWECSWQTIREIDSENNDVYFNTPCRYPVGFFSDHARYRIENIPAALDEAGEWYLNRETGELSYLAHAGQDPRSMEFIAPRLKRFLTLHGEAERQKFVEHIEFRDITFQYARYPMGIYDVAPDWPKPAREAHGDWPENFPPGYTDSQASPRCGQAIDLIATRNCIFRDCEVSHVGAYAISLGRDCHNNTVYGCHLYDLGGGGVRLGVDIREVKNSGFAEENAPSYNNISRNRIARIGSVHPSAVGIWIAQSHDDLIAHNEIAYTGYSGISLGWTWSSNPNYTHDVTVRNNHIHHVLQALADGGGIYTLGKLEGCLLLENYIHSIHRPAGAIGSHNNGLFFDESSEFIRVKRNVIRDIGHQAVRFNRNKKEDHTWIENDFAEGEEKIELKSVVENAGKHVSS